ncbi:MAG: ABC transporter substrate-binding protein [Gemmatimonadota bacterium]
MSLMFAAALAACGGRESDSPPAAVGGTIIIATGGDADALLPPLVQTITGKEASDLLFLPLAKPSDSLNVVGGDRDYSPQLASRWEWSSDSLEVTFRLDPRARWHDGTPVSAEDLRFTLSLYREPAIASPALAELSNVASITAADTLTAVVHFRARGPTQFHDFVFNFRPVPRHVYSVIAAESLASSVVARMPTGNGRFRFARWEPGVRLELVADTAHWAGRPLLDRVIWTINTDAVAAAGQLAAAEVDMIETLRATQIQRVAGDSDVQIVSRPSLDYALAVFNTRHRDDSTLPHPVFGDAMTRRALSMAVDRRVVVANVLDSLGVVMEGPFLTFQNLGDVKLAPFDVDRATALLDSAGWKDDNGDGIRERNGARLEFGILVPTISQPRMRAAVLLQDAFRRVGAAASVEALEFAASSQALFRGAFDLALVGYSGDPTPGFISQLFGSGAPQNFGHYQSPRFDAVLDSADRETDPTRSRQLFTRAGQIVADEAPTIWLYEVKSLTGLNRRIIPAAMRVDAWWANLDRWSIDPTRRLERDRIGAGSGRGGG